MSAVKKTLTGKGKGGGSAKKLASDKAKGKLNNGAKLGGVSKSKQEVVSKTDEELRIQVKPVEVPEESVLVRVEEDAKPDLEEEKKEEEKEEEEEEEHIEYINLDEIDCSDSEEATFRLDNNFSSMSDRVYDEDVLEYMKSLGLKGSADSLELEILKMPPLDLVTTETRTSRESRRIIIYPVSTADMSHSTVQRILSRDSCNHFTVKCDRTGDSRAWSGCAILNFLTSSDAATAISELRQMRRSLHIEQGTSVDSKFAKLQPQSPEKDWTEMMLVVKNIGDSTTDTVLKELFPDADVVIHKNKAGSTAKGHAYLLYSSAERAKEVLEKYSEKKLEINGRRLILLKWRQTIPKLVPDGMLRIGERRLVMKVLDETKTKLEKSLEKEYQQAKINFLQDLIDRDDGVRKLVGLPMSSYDQLKKLVSLRQFGESESSQIIKRLMEPFDKLIKEKDKDKVRDRESEREKERQRYQESAAKSKQKSGNDGKSAQNSRSDSRSTDSRNTNKRGGLASRGKGSTRWDNPSSRPAPIPLLSTPMMPMKRNSGTGLLGAGPSDPTLMLFQQQQQQQQQQHRAAMVQPLLSAQPLLQSPGCFSVAMQPAPNSASAVSSLLRNQSSLLGNYPGELSASRGYDDEPYSKISRYGTMESVKDQQDLLSQIYGDRDQGVRAKEYDHGRHHTASREDLEAAYERELKLHYRDDRDSSRDRGDDPYYRKELLSSGVRSLDVEELFRDEMSLGRSESHQSSRSLLGESHQSSRSLLGSTPHHEDEASRDEYRRYDERDERRMRDTQGRGDDRMSRMEEDSSRRQSSSSSSAKADPVSLLLNLSQLLAEKLQRDKDKEKRGGGY